MENTIPENRRNTGRGVHFDVSGPLVSIIFLIIEIVLVHFKFWLFTLESLYYFLCPPEKRSVRDEIVLITGTAHGIGKELALKYANLGAEVVCWDKNENGNIETVEEITSRGGKAHAYVCDVSKREDIKKKAEMVKNEIGPVSILVNNAGIMPCHTLLDHTEQEIRNIFDINVLANLWLIQEFLPDMIERNHGHIVALSSCAGLFGLKNLVPYCGSKYAVRGIMQALYEELRVDERKPDVKLTTIYPYMVDTGLCKKPHSRFPKLMKLVKPEEAAAAIITAQRQGLEEFSIPKIFLYIESIGRLFPKKSARAVNDFLDTGVNSDK